MTTPIPITPPPELVQQWVDQLLPQGSMKAFNVAAQWGANQELEACCEWLMTNRQVLAASALGAARRPKPPSLKLQALNDLNAAYNEDAIDDTTYCNIRRALEAMNDD